jgi:hypothetical protein
MLTSEVGRKFFLSAIVSSFLLVGCEAAEEYERIAQAGNDYINAVNSLLDTSANIRIDSTSEFLIHTDSLAGINQETYNEISQTDLEWLMLLGQVRQHNQLLAEYFTLLGELATSDSPENSRSSIDNVVASLEEIGASLSDDVRTVVGPITQLVVSGQIRGALRDELEQRKDVIQEQLLLQEQLLELLTRQISEDLRQIRIFQEDRLIEPSILSDTPISVGQQERWINERRRILLLQTTSDKLVAAKDASREFRNLFEDLVEGRLTTQRINFFLDDIDEILRIIESTQDSQDTESQEE